MNDRATHGAEFLDEAAREHERTVHRLRPVSISELFQRPEPHWVIRNVLRERSLAVLFGPSGSGKTFLALDLAFAVSLCRRWFGLRVKQGNVIYVAGEGHLVLRIKAYMQQHGADAADLEPFRVIASNVNLLERQSDDLAYLLQELRLCAGGMGPIALVVLDTLNAMMAGGDENSSQDMGLIIEAAKQIMAALGCAVLFVHHSGKDESKGSRGHSSLKAALDTEIQITNNGAGRLVEITKSRDGETGQQFPFRLDPIDLGPDPDPDADPADRIGSCVVVPLDHMPEAKPKGRRLTAGAQVALDALYLAIEQHGERMPETSALPKGVRAVRLDGWQDAYAAMRPVPHDLPAPDSRKERNSRRMAFKRAQDELQAARAVGTGAGFWWIT